MEAFGRAIGERTSTSRPRGRFHACATPFRLASRAMDDAGDDDAALVARLRAGDETAFARAFADHYALLFRLSLTYVRTPSAAEEIVQDTWLSVIDALDSFERRSTFKTWIARIAVNKAKSRAAKEARNVPLASVEEELATDEPA